MDSVTLVIGFVFSTIGGGCLLYARRTRRVLPLCVGSGLLAFPWVFDTALPLLVASVLLLSAGWLLRD